MESVHTKNGICLAAALAIAAPFGAPALASAALGGAIQLVNLWLLHRSVGRVLNIGSGAVPRGLQAVLVLRLVGLLGLVAVLLLLLPLAPIWFTVGLSIAVPASLWHGLAHARALRGHGA